MKKLIITGTLLLTVIAGSTSSYATSCTPDVWVVAILVKVIQMDQ